MFFVGCTRPAETSKLTFSFPKPQVMSHKSEYFKSTVLTSSGTPWSGSISASSEINCYIVAVGGPQPDLEMNNCKAKNTNQVLATFGPLEGGVPAGQSISIEVPSGPDRRIYLFGTKASTEGCIDFTINGPPQGKNSYPRLLNTVTKSLSPGEQTITMSVPASLANLPEVDQCEVFPAGGEGGIPSLDLFGDGRDGDLTILSNATISFGTDGYNHGSVTLVNSALPNPSTKKFSTQRRVTGISTDGLTLATGNTFTSDDFEPGDEIFWTVSAAYHSSGPDFACGGNLFRGSWGTAHVVSTGTSYLVLDEPISDSPATISGTALSQNVPDNAGANPFCRIQIARVPNFESVTIGAGVSTLATFQPMAYVLDSAGNGVGGIVFFRTRSLNLNGAAFEVNVNVKGFQSNIQSAGDGTAGKPTSNYLYGGNASGGGYNGGGGANSGIGGVGYTGGSALGGAANSFCMGSTTCLPFLDKKVFFGGAGGGNGGSPGGAGGGIATVFADEISGTGNLTLTANGEQTSGAALGGGAGGAVHLSVRTLNVSYSQLAFSSDGGSTTGANSAAGGGGSVEVLFCDVLSIPTAAEIYTTTYASGGTDVSTYSDASGGETYVEDSPLICNAL